MIRLPLDWALIPSLNVPDDPHPVAGELGNLRPARSVRIRISRESSSASAVSG